MSELPDDLFATIHGFISLPEAELLHRLALEVPRGGKVVEIGSYRARSTVALALGAKEVGAMVYAIDHHPAYEQGGTHFGMEDNQYYYESLVHYGVGDVVKTINLPSYQTFVAWVDDIDLLWIDGGHEYEQVRTDWHLWSHFANVVAMHDTAGHHAGVDRMVTEIIASGEWVRPEVVDSISVFRRIIEE